MIRTKGLAGTGEISSVPAKFMSAKFQKKSFVPAHLDQRCLQIQFFMEKDVVSSYRKSVSTNRCYRLKHICTRPSWRGTIGGHFFQDTCFTLEST